VITPPAWNAQKRRAGADSTGPAAAAVTRWPPPTACTASANLSRRDGQPSKPEKEKKDSWAARVLPEPRLGLTILVGARAMLETCGSAGKGTDVKEGVPSR
jgi:hypothetical protein